MREPKSLRKISIISRTWFFLGSSFSVVDIIFPSIKLFLSFFFSFNASAGRKMCVTPSEWNFQLFNDRSDNFEWSEK